MRCLFLTACFYSPNFLLLHACGVKTSRSNRPDACARMDQYFLTLFIAACLVAQLNGEGGRVLLIHLSTQTRRLVVGRWFARLKCSWCPSRCFLKPSLAWEHWLVLSVQDSMALFVLLCSMKTAYFLWCWSCKLSLRAEWTLPSHDQAQGKLLSVSRLA